MNDGTLCRQVSYRPGVVHHAKSGHAATQAVRRKQQTLPVLKQGNYGPLVSKVQKLLNARLQPSPNLKVDGIFGPRTNECVIRFQRFHSLRADGLIGKQTWYYLLSTPKPTPASIPPIGSGPAQKDATSDERPKSGSILSMSAQQHAAADVGSWTLQHKFSEMGALVPNHLPREIRSQFLGLVQPESLAIGLVYSPRHTFSALANC